MTFPTLTWRNTYMCRLTDRSIGLEFREENRKKFVFLFYELRMDIQSLSSFCLFVLRVLSKMYVWFVHSSLSLHCLTGFHLFLTLVSFYSVVIKEETCFPRSSTPSPRTHWVPVYQPQHRWTSYILWGHFSVWDPSSKMGQASGRDLRPMQAQQGDGT